MSIGDLYYLFLPSSCALSVALPTVSMKAPRTPCCSSVFTPTIVLPPGEQTISLSSPGCLPVSSTILAAPNTVCAASLCAVALGSFNDSDRGEELFGKILFLSTEISIGIKCECACAYECRSVRHKSEQPEITIGPVTKRICSDACHDGNHRFAIKCAAEFLKSALSVLWFK